MMRHDVAQHCCLFHGLVDLLGKIRPFCTARDGCDLAGLVRGFIGAYDSEDRLGKPWSPDEHAIRDILRDVPLASVRWDKVFMAILADDLRQRQPVPNINGFGDFDT